MVTLLVNSATGVRQGDSLSPLFSLADEDVLSTSVSLLIKAKKCS